MNTRNPSPAPHPKIGWYTWHQRLTYLFTPEDSTVAAQEDRQAMVGILADRLKVIVWIGLSLVAALAIAQL